MKITTAQQLSNYIQDIRLSQGLSQAKVGEQIGLRQGTISNFEKNPKSTKLETFFKILSVLELQIELKPRNNFNPDGTQKSNAKEDKGGWEHEW